MPVDLERGAAVRHADQCDAELCRGLGEERVEAVLLDQIVDRV
jgi:hypothetical protein